MAEPAPLPADEPMVDPESLGDPSEEKVSRALRDELLNDFLPSYEPKLHITEQVDNLNNRFTINTKKPLPHLNTATAQAFTATDSINTEKSYYALVCAQHMQARRDLAAKLLLAENSPLVKLFAEGVVRISSMQEERYVLVYEQPKGQTLHDIISSQTQTFSDRYVIERVVRPLCNALTVIEKLGFSHGNVNPKNIYMDDGKLMLSECCSEPCGYSQDFHYEPINFIQAHKAGKGYGQNCIDYYALGVVVALMKLKPKSLQIQDREMFLRRLLEEGSYIGIAGYVDLSDEMNDILRGTLNDNAHERWKSEQIEPWTNGKRFNLLTPNIPNIGSRPFEFQNQGFLNLRQLANAVYLYPEQAIPLLQDGSLSRWIEMSTRRKEITEYLTSVVKSYRSITKESVREIVTRCLFAMDRAAPMRLRSLSFHIDGVNSVLAELYHQKDNAGLNILKDSISNSMFANWQEVQSVSFGITKIDPVLQQAVWSMDRARLDINNKNFGFGVERLLYDLNPMLPCQSDIVKQYHATNLTELMIALDHVSKQSDRPSAPFDRHIAAFIGAKISLNNTIKFTEYEYSQAAANHQGLLALKFLQKAQVQAGKAFPGLSAWVVASFTDIIGSFHSGTLRKDFCSQLEGMAKEGNLQTILHYITTYDYSTADIQGFMTATKQYYEFSGKIEGYNNEELLEFRSYKLGNAIAKAIAFAVFVIMCIYYFNAE